MARKIKRFNQFLVDHPEFTSGQLRWWVFHGESNGMTGHGVIVRIGRAIWIDEEAFDRWIVAQNPGLRPIDTRAQA